MNEPMGGEEDENQSLMDALAALPPSEEENAGFLIAEGEMQAPADLVNAPDAPMPGDSLPDLGDQPLPDGSPDPFAPPAEEEFSALEPASDLSVDEMLADAVLHEPSAIATSGPLPLNGAAHPSFQLQLQPETAAQREKLKNLAQTFGLPLRESPGSAPMISQLTEYQALSFRQAALALGVGVKVNVNFPLPSLTEEEQALGDLAAVPDAAGVKVEGAPSVTLPVNEKDVLLLPESAAGLQIVETLGIVTAHRSIARRFFREEEAREKLEKELSRVQGKKALPSSRLEGLFRELFLDLQKSALARGGNGVLGIRLEAFPETANLDPSLEQLRLVAFGTAAVVEKL
jgi:uncharacterized protein YbjQ (UPF0145 family)